MERWRGRVAVVTGASAGIGAAIAYQLQDAGVDVVALARREEKIPEAVEAARKAAKSRNREQTNKAQSPGKLHCLKCDVSKEADILAAFKWIKENTKGVDIMVNNAGIVGSASLVENNTADWKRVIDTNVLGLSICTREAVQQMKARGVDDGHVIHISSMLGHVNPNWPRYTIYCASKHAVRVLTEGLRKELVAAKSRIRVTEVSPGVVKTDIANNMGQDLETFWKQPHMQPEDIADAVLYALGVPPHVQARALRKGQRSRRQSNFSLAVDTVGEKLLLLQPSSFPIFPRELHEPLDADVCFRGQCPSLAARKMSRCSIFHSLGRHVTT